MEKKFKRRDGFRGENIYISPHPLKISPTEKDARKRLMQKRPMPKK